MYKPEGAKVLVEAMRVEEKTKGGLYLPETSRDSEQTRVTRGTILAIGPDAVIRFGDDRPAKIGDSVIFSKYGGFSVSEEGEKRDFRILNDEDIVALIE